MAVLPLANLSGDPEQEYFVDGLHDLLIGELAGIGGLKVISRTSVLRYKEGSQSLGEIARELGVEALMEGSVYRVGDTVRINAQLVRAFPEEHLWQDRYEGSLSEALSLQIRVAEAMAHGIRLTLSPEEANRLEDEAAALFQEGTEANQQSDDYILNAVILASVLFLGGIAPRFTWRPIRIGILVLAVLLLALGLYNLITYPVA